MKTARYWGAPIAIVLLIALSACDAEEPVAMPDVLGKTLDVAKSDIERAGHSGDIEIVGGGLFGIMDDSNWVVCEQEPAADRDISEPRLVVDRDCGADSEEAPSEEEEAPTAETSAPADTDVESVITAESDAAFAAILTLGDNCDPQIADFAAQHAGDQIMFDGAIAAMNNHGDYDTRYDLLLVPGDYSETAQVGPTFQYRDVNVISDLKYSGDVPESIGVGQNLTITAEIDEYDANSCLFFIEPVSTSFR